MDVSTHVSAHLFVNLFQSSRNGGILQKFVGNSIRTGYGISDFFSFLDRAARKVIFQSLVRSGRAVMGDVLDGSRSEAACRNISMKTKSYRNRFPCKTAQAKLNS